MPPKKKPAAKTTARKPPARGKVKSTPAKAKEKAKSAKDKTKKTTKKVVKKDEPPAFGTPEWREKYKVGQSKKRK